jgi:hypothetical protein
MQYSLLVKTDFGVPSCRVEFQYDEKETRFTNIKITNLAADIEYRVDDYFPIKSTMRVEALDLFNTGADDDYASDIYIKISKDNKIICQQCLVSNDIINSQESFDNATKYWNLQLVENSGTYELVENKV